MEKENFEDYIKNISNNIDFNENMLKKINNMYLSSKEIDILNKYSIKYNTCFSYNELLFKIQDSLDEFYDIAEDLDIVAENIAERNYYSNTNK